MLAVILKRKERVIINFLNYYTSTRMKDLKTIKQIYFQLKAIMSKKQKKNAVFISIAILVGAIFELLGVSAIVPFIESVMSPETLVRKWYIRPIAEFFKIENANMLLNLVAITIIIVYIIKNIYLAFSTYLCAKFRFDLKKELSAKLLNNYINRPYTFFIESNSAQLMHGIDHDVPGVCTIIEYTTLFVKEMLSFLAIGIFMVIIDPYMAVGTIILAGLSLLGITIGFKKILSKFGKMQREAEIYGSKSAYQMLCGSKEIIVYKRTQFFLTHYYKAIEIIKSTSVGNAFIAALPERIIESVCIGGIIGVVCIRVNMGIDLVTFVPNLGVFAVAAFRILPSVSRMAGYINEIVFQRPHLETTYQYISHSGKEDKYSDKAVCVLNEKINSMKFKEKIEIRNICWRYPNNEKVVINDLSIDILKGEAVAFIGTSGSGKTTLVDIILGLLKPERGTVKIDGKDIYDNLGSWAKLIGYVPQNIFFLDGTIKENVAFGSDEEISDEQVWRVLEKAQIKEFVQELPDQINSFIGERGVKISGGQRQRLAIARALYHDPEILVLDEATSALDTETESTVMEAIDRLQGEKTLIIVAHRLLTIKKCNRIYEIKDGKAIRKSVEEVLKQ